MKFPLVTLGPWERRHIVTVVPIALAALVGLASLGTDVGDFYFNRTLLQNAADSAVAAGSVYLPSDPALAIKTANDWAESNGIVSTEIVSTAVSADGRQIQMRLARTVPFFYARAFGLHDAVARVQATGEVSAKSTRRRTAVRK
jgi:hypothetical protein